MFRAQKNIMKRVGFTDEDVTMIFTILAAILHLTNIRFQQDDDTDGVYVENETPLEISKTGEKKTIRFRYSNVLFFS